jgi:glutamate carboxypeptidase
METTEVRNFLNQRLPDALELLRQMVGINSFTTNKEGVEQLATFTTQAFGKFGFQPELVPSVRPEFARHLVLTRKGRNPACIGLISHLDTVYPADEEKRNNFSWRPAGEKIYGPGTNDIKGGTVVIYLALEALQKFAPHIFEEMTWVVLLNSSEEVYSADFGKLCLQKLGSQCLGALVFESGVHSDNTYSLVTARKGRAVFRVTVEGRGAHAGSHHDRGANAIVQLAEVIQKISALTDYQRELTYNVGLVSGGLGLNRIPHLAQADGEMRTFDMATYREGVQKLLALNGPGSVRSASDHHPCQVKIEIAQESPPWPRNEGTERLFKAFHETGRGLGMSLVREERGGISDGNFICNTIPTIDGLGVNGDNAHCSEQSADGSKEQEFVEVASIVPKAALTALGILKLVEGK